MRVWANRMGPILAKRIGHHQRGFISTQDGRENIINVQLLIDLINAKNEEGVIIFLDQEKAFNMVSFTAINKIFDKLEWPTRFRSLVHTVYKKDQVKAKIRVNSKLSHKACHINSGTRQGCPLSPLIFAVVADLFNMSVMTVKSQLQSNGSLVGPLSPIQADRNYRIFFLYRWPETTNIYTGSVC